MPVLKETSPVKTHGGGTERGMGETERGDQPAGLAVRREAGRGLPGRAAIRYIFSFFKSLEQSNSIHYRADPSPGGRWGHGNQRPSTPEVLKRVINESHFFISPSRVSRPSPLPLPHLIEKWNLR